MPTLRFGSTAALFLMWALAPSVAQAQQPCAEGRTASGDCVRPGLAAGLRQTAIIFAQPKISETAYPVLPNADRAFRYPNQVISAPWRIAPCCGPPVP